MKTIGLARLGRDAEVRNLPDGTAVANLSLAVTVFDKNAEHNRGTQWIDATLWGQQAERLAQYMRKGSVHCFTLSDLKLETYQGQNGQGHKMTARVDSVELGPRAEGGQQPAPAQGQQQRSQPPAQRMAQPQGQPATAKTQSGFDDMDSDIPF